MNFLGVDAGATWIKATQYTGELEAIKTTKIASGAPLSPKEYFASIAKAVAEVDNSESAIGLALPAMFSPDGATIQYMVNVKGLGVGTSGMPLKDAFPALAKRSFIAQNDASCAAVGEWAKGLGQADMHARLLHLTWGTGIGVGLIVNGEPQYCWEGGHLPVSWDTPSNKPCNCGSSHDIEAFASITNISWHAQQLVKTGAYTTTLTEDKLLDSQTNGRLLREAAEAGDELAGMLLREALLWIARGLHAMAVLARPTIVTVGGGLMKGDWVLAELKKKISQETNGLLSLSLPVESVQAGQLGNTAGMIGAAYLAKQKLEKASRKG